MGKHNRKPRTIICEGCGVTVVTNGTRTIWCKECADKQREVYEARHRAKRRLAKPVVVQNNDITFHDSPEEIQKCLSCKRPTCKNCLEYRRNLQYRKKA